MIQNETLKGHPFYLSDAQIDWVRRTYAGMTLDEKVGQLFCMAVSETDKRLMDEMLDRYHVAGYMCRALMSNDILEINQYMLSRSKIPLLVAANFECGPDGIAKDAVDIGANLQIGATGNPENARIQGEVCAREGCALGANWSFAPVVDIEYNWRNPIVGSRAYGDDPEFVARCGEAYIRGAQENGLAASVKHFPGDGLDERDQHLVTSINSFSCEQWDATYGRVYRRCIDAGTLSLMVGHIMQPAYSRRLRPGIRDEDIMPATCAPELLLDLLRGQLGYNGLIVSDEINMAGSSVLVARGELLPRMIASGCDMLLFSANMEEDFAIVRDAVSQGIITSERLEDAITRTLAMKAALHLPEKQANGTLVPTAENARRFVRCGQDRALDRSIAQASVTLVKDTQGLLPIHPKTHRRIYLHVLADGKEYNGKFPGVSRMMKDKLEAEGFEVTVHDNDKPLGPFGWQDRYDAIADHYDLILYALNIATFSNRTVVRIDWPNRSYPRFIPAVPTLMVSFANPYHLVDAPRVKTYINAYKFKESTVDAVIDKILGRSEFKGRNPVDPFCGFWDAHL